MLLDLKKISYIYDIYGHIYHIYGHIYHIYGHMHHHMIYMAIYMIYIYIHIYIYTAYGQIFYYYIPYNDYKSLRGLAYYDKVIGPYLGPYRGPYIVPYIGPYIRLYMQPFRAMAIYVYNIKRDRFDTHSVCNWSHAAVLPVTRRGRKTKRRRRHSTLTVEDSSWMVHTPRCLQKSHSQVQNHSSPIRSISLEADHCQL